MECDRRTTLIESSLRSPSPLFSEAEIQGTMISLKALRAQLADHQQLIDLQTVEISHQRRQMEVQIRRSADMQAQLDRLTAGQESPRRPARLLSIPVREQRSSGNGRDDH